MNDSHKYSERATLSMHYAEVLHQYQQNHHRLMEALGNDDVTMEEFEAMSARLNEDVVLLKEIKKELTRRRQDGDSRNDGKARSDGHIQSDSQSGTAA
jgi:hypothetical protein